MGLENLHASGRNCRVKHTKHAATMVCRNYLVNGSGKLPVILKIPIIGTDNTGTSADPSPARRVIWAYFKTQIADQENRRWKLILK